MKFLIKNIRNKYELENAIFYLKESFQWSKKKANNLKNFIFTNNKNFGMYGYILINNKNNIVGAILFFYKEYLNTLDKKIKVINVSSWHVNQEARGIYSLLMIRRILEDYPKFLITNVSANEKAYHIFKALKFTDSNLFNKKYSIFNVALNKRIFDISNLILIFNPNLHKICQIPFENLDNRYSCRLFYLGNNQLKIISCKTILERKIGFLKIRIRGLRILWTSDQEIFISNFYKILIFYFLRNFALFTTTHCEYFSTKVKPLSITNQLYYSCEDHKNTNLALWSELPFI